MKSLEQLTVDLEGGTTTSLALVQECFSVIATKNGEINAFIGDVYKEEALAAAQDSDERRAAGKPLSEFDGIPVALKANISHKDHITSAGSNILKNYIAPYDATVVSKLKDAGAIILGSLNMDEFAMGSSGENSAFGSTKNPLDTACVPGGSSSGAAASVAAGMVPLSFGSDTGGSIRQPAALCGAVGLKPTYGAVSRYGLLALASSLDQIGPITTSVAGAKKAFDLIKGQDSLDSTSQKGEYLEVKDKYTIGVPKQFMDQALHPGIKALLEDLLHLLEENGHTIKKDIDLPSLDASLMVYYILQPAEASSNLARYDGIRFGLKSNSVVESRTQGFGAEVKRRIMLGTFALSAGYADAYYKRAQASRAAHKKRIDKVFETCDMLLGSVTPEPPFRLGEKTSDPMTMYASDIYTLFVNLCGLPALSVPGQKIPLGDGVDWPIGIHLVGKQWGEEQLFDLGSQIERVNSG